MSESHADDESSIDGIDWSVTTWEGSRRAQLRRWCALTLRERFSALEEMTQLAARFSEMRERAQTK